MTLEALGLPDRYVDRIDSITDSCHDPSNDQLHALSCRCLQNCPNYHDPASPRDTTLTTIAVGGQECYDCAYETAEVIYSGDNAFKLGAWIVEVSAKRRQPNHGTKNTLVVAEKLAADRSVLR